MKVALGFSLGVISTCAFLIFYAVGHPPTIARS